MKRPVFLLDTNIVSEILKPHPSQKVLNRLEQYEDLCAISATTWNELLFGVNTMQQGKRRDFIYSTLIDIIQARFPIISLDNHGALIQADISSRLKEKGQTKDYADTEIAAIATSNCMILVTRNIKDFEPMQEVSALQLEDWF